MATKASAAPAGRGRLWQIDAVRGLMLVLMTLTHVPTRWSSPAGQPFGYVSAAEGFVLLSAFMAGWIYSERARKRGVPEMQSAFLRRVLKIYLSQAALLFFLFSAVAAIGLLTRQSAVTNLVSFYLAHPVEALAGSLLLVYNPPLLDILPMYILFMLGSSLLLVLGRRNGWAGLLALSTLLWLGAQFGLGRALYDAVVRVTGLAIPLAETGAFDILAWQMPWMIGLWMGAAYAEERPFATFPRWSVALALAIGTIGFAWRHAVGQAPFAGDPGLAALLDKWQLGPLRVLNLFALVVLAIHFAPWLARRLPRVRALELLGAASLPVFCAHLVFALLTLAVLGEASAERSGWLADTALLAACFAALYAVALVSRQIDRRSARVRAAFAAAQARRMAVRDGRRTQRR